MPEPERRRTLSPDAATHLRAAATSMADPELQHLFNQLASLADPER